MKKAKLIALLAAVVAFILIFFLFNAISQSGNRSTTEVLTAAIAIPANTIITDEMITVSEIPDAAILSGAITEKELVLGRIAKSDIFAGEQILEGKMILPGESGNNTLAYSIEPGMRAITIPVDSNTGLSGMLKPQDKIDIISELDYQPVGGEPKTYTTLIAENIKLLAIDNILSEQGKTGDQDAAPSYSNITLEVTLKQAMEISLAAYTGQLRAVLRSPLDENINNLPNITIENVMNN